jgi:SAM-dependent methyltransferase
MLDPHVLSLLACPACLGHPLLAEEAAALLRCSQCGRAFTLRAGVPDLIWGKTPPNEGPGDTAAMVRNRVALDRRLVRASPSTARYIAEALRRLSGGRAVLDVGTGPGTMLALLLERARFPLTAIGFDKSLPALDAARVALRGRPRSGLVRASARRPFPFRAGSFAVVLRRLAPALPGELLRVLAPGGTALNYTHGERHWREVYDALPDLPRPRQGTAPDQTEAALRGQGFAESRVDVLETREGAGVAEVMLALKANPAAHFLDAVRAHAVLEDLSLRQGRDGRSLLLTSHVELRLAVRGEPAP